MRLLSLNNTKIDCTGSFNKLHRIGLLDVRDDGDGVFANPFCQIVSFEFEVCPNFNFALGDLVNEVVWPGDFDASNEFVFVIDELNIIFTG